QTSPIYHFKFSISREMFIFLKVKARSPNKIWSMQVTSKIMFAGYNLQT
ncbi:unnamed protein product, partial [Musa acuminata subsp. malaccensis]